MHPTSPSRSTTLGLWLGIVAMALFGLTLPMTRLATGTQDAPQLSPWFVTCGRAVLAAALSIAVLLLTRSAWPRREHWKPLAIAALGNAIGYPLLLAWALRSVDASHAAVVTALLPLATAVAAAWLFRQRPSLGFWACALAGSAIVVAFSLWRSHQFGAGYTLTRTDALLAGAVVAASVGYVYGARITPALGAERVICWVTVIALPITLPGAWLSWPQAPVETTAWVGFIYVALFSMWIAFFAWYRALAIGDAVRVSQVQLLQPFFAIGFSVPLLGERVDAVTMAFALAVIATVFAGRRMPAGRPGG